MRKYWIVLLQTLLSLIVLVKLASDGALRAEVLQVFSTANPSWLLAGFCTALLSEFACAIRWWFLLRALGTPIPFKKVLIFCGAGLFFSLSLPGGAGGDAFRFLYGIQQYPTRKLRVSLTIFGDRLCGLAALFFTFSAIWFHPDRSLEAQPEVQALVLSAQWVLVSTVLLLFMWWLSTLRFSKKLWLPEFMRRLRKKTDQLSRIFTGLALRPKWVLAGVLTSLLSLGAHFCTYFCSARAFEVPIKLHQMLNVMPIVDTFVMLPISFSGLGVREVLFEKLLGGLYGVAPAGAVLTSLGGFVLQALVAGVGGIFIPFTLPSPAVESSDKLNTHEKG